MELSDLISQVMHNFSKCISIRKCNITFGNIVTQNTYGNYMKKTSSIVAKNPVTIIVMDLPIACQRRVVTSLVVLYTKAVSTKYYKWLYSTDKLLTLTLGNRNFRDTDLKASHDYALCTIHSPEALWQMISSE